jgi:hypothetical protein
MAQGADRTSNEVSIRLVAVLFATLTSWVVAMIFNSVELFFGLSILQLPVWQNATTGSREAAGSRR